MDLMPFPLLVLATFLGSQSWCHSWFQQVSAVTQGFTSFPVICFCQPDENASTCHRLSNTLTVQCVSLSPIYFCSGSGNEKLHDLGFDASKTWAAYSFRWSKGKIEWYVNGKKLREEGWKPEKPVPLQSYSTARIVANIWPVNEQAEEWAGDLDHSISTVTAHYKWIRYDEGESCDIPTSC